MHKISIRWVDGMISVFDVENFQILPGHVWMRYTDGKERWIPNTQIRYVDYDTNIKNTDSGDGCLAEQIKDVMLKRRLCDMEQSTISEIEDDLIATGTRPDNEKLMNTLNRMVEDGVIQTLGVGNSNIGVGNSNIGVGNSNIGVGNSKEQDGTWTYALMR